MMKSRSLRAGSRTDSRSMSRATDGRSASRTSEASSSGGGGAGGGGGPPSAMELLLAQQREELKSQARKLGYHRPDIERALNLGCPANNMECLLDNLANM